MRTSLASIFGPRVPSDERRAHFLRYLLPTALLIVGGVLFAVSFFQPYWRMTLQAPQYPKGLHVQAYLNRLVGDVHEIDGLNHYIGMRPLNDAAQFERANSVMLVIVIAGLLLAAALIHNRWAVLPATPAILYPIGFLADLQYWLATFGTHLDPHAALSNSIKPFVPPVLGVGTIGQFKTIADAGPGFWIATVGSVLVLAALWFHRRAYKPLVQRQAAQAQPTKAAVAVAALMLLAPCARAEQPATATPEHPLAALLNAAAEGATIRIPAGTYPGGLLIRKPVTLVADGAVTIDGHGEGELIRIAVPDVTIRGFHLCGSGDSLERQHAGITVTAPRAVIEDCRFEDVLMGISLNSAADSIVRRNSIIGKDVDLGRRGDAIRTWNSNGVLIENNRIQAARDIVIWYSADAHVVGNEVHDSRYGLHFMYASGSTVESNQMSDNSVGMFLMYSHDVLLRRNVLDHNRGPSGYGIGLKDMDGVRVEENLILANRIGIYIDNSPSRIDGRQDVTGNIFACNDVGLALLPSVRHNRVYGNDFRENIEQVAILGNGDLHDNVFAVDGRGNHWSNYAGLDLNGDGIGDQPYQDISLFEDLIDREPRLRMFIYSPAHQAIDLASRAFPILQPKPKITDPNPLMRGLAAPVQPRTASTGLPMSVVGGGLLALTALLTGAWRPRSSVAATDRNQGRDETRTAVAPTVAPTLAAISANDGAAPLIRIRGLTKRFGRQVAVAGLDLDVAPGSALALWGTNGAGKTTILKCILGLHACRGDIRIGDFDVRRAGKAARRLVGYVSQELSFYDDLTTRDSARFFARLKRVPVRRADEILERVGLGAHAAKRVGALSGGMKQRLALAVALLDDPPLLLLDEPTSNLDAAARRSFFELLRELRLAGKTIIFTTHRPEEVIGLADQVIILEHGRVLHNLDKAGFATLAGAQAVVRIPLAAKQRRAALGVLRTAGFDASENHTAVVVRVPPDRKAAALGVLLRNGFDVADFELESEQNHVS